METSLLVCLLFTCYFPTNVMPSLYDKEDLDPDASYADPDDHKRRNLEIRIQALSAGIKKMKSDIARMDKIIEYIQALSVPWPRGTYGLPKPISGCPSANPAWLEGWRHQYMEGQGVGSVFSYHWSKPNHFDATLKMTDYYRRFCIKSHREGDAGPDWPPGDYCVLKYSSCPAGFEEGYVKWDDDDTENHNSYGGTLPDGVYNEDTLMRYCCRNDSDAVNEIILPTIQPFYLYQYKGRCQQVKGMTVTVEYLVFDDEDGNTPSKAEIGTVHPGMYFSNQPWSLGGTVSKIYYCYYQKNQDSV